MQTGNHQILTLDGTPPVLRCSKAPWIYIGCTNCIEKRLVQHNDGEVYSTKSRLPVELMYYEAYKTKERAYERENKLKSYGSSLAKLKSRIGITKKGRAG